MLQELEQELMGIDAGLLQKLPPEVARQLSSSAALSAAEADSAVAAADAAVLREWGRQSGATAEGSSSVAREVSPQREGGNYVGQPGAAGVDINGRSRAPRPLAGYAGQTVTSRVARELPAATAMSMRVRLSAAMAFAACVKQNAPWESGSTLLCMLQLSKAAGLQLSLLL